MNNQCEFIITLRVGERTVGVIRRSSAREARTVSQSWNAGGEGHTSKVERRELLIADKVDNIASDQYLVQGVG
jgi:hypothetical protein